MIELIGVKVLDVIKQIQQAIVYIEDRLLEPFNLQELSDYVGLSPYHLDRSFKMIVGLSPEAYARARKMTLAANDVINGATRLVDIAKNITMQIQMILQMILVIFTAYHLFKLLLKKMNYKFKSDYISNYQLLREHPIHTD